MLASLHPSACFFLGCTILLFSYMGLFSFLTQPNMQRTWGEKIQEKVSLSLIFLYVFVSKEC